ncbi:MAG TPA: GTP cyclohydrolase I [Roseiflexaceae bacterium]|nr:GTP cyclohydrolase I [Roseiflexaceae bacterium]
MSIDLDLNDYDVLAAMELRRRDLSDEQLQRFESYAAEIFSAFGLELDTSATRETPRRFIRALYDSTAGYDGGPKLLTVFGTECRGGSDCRLSQVIEGPIQFYALCEHHALPFYGHAYVGYIAHEHIIGISKFTRLVRCSPNALPCKNASGGRLLMGWRVCFSRMASHLLDNAVKYSPADGVITVCVEQQNAKAVLTISDQGIGIPEAARAQLPNRSNQTLLAGGQQNRSGAACTTSTPDSEDVQIARRRYVECSPASAYEQ